MKFKLTMQKNVHFHTGRSGIGWCTFINTGIADISIFNQQKRCGHIASVRFHWNATTFRIETNFLRKYIFIYLIIMLFFLLVPHLPFSLHLQPPPPILLSLSLELSEILNLYGIWWAGVTKLLGGSAYFLRSTRWKWDLTLSFVWTNEKCRKLNIYMKYTVLCM